MLVACGYIRLTSKPSPYLHRFLMNAPRGLVVDHKNGDPLDNRKANLRLVTRRENARNVSGGRGTSRLLGVSLNKATGLYRSRIYYEGKEIWLGYFQTEAEANLARLRKEKELFGIQPRRLQAFIDAGLAEAA